MGRVFGIGTTKPHPPVTPPRPAMPPHAVTLMNAEGVACASEKSVGSIGDAKTAHMTRPSDVVKQSEKEGHSASGTLAPNSHSRLEDRMVERLVANITPKMEASVRRLVREQLANTDGVEASEGKDGGEKDVAGSR